MDYCAAVFELSLALGIDEEQLLDLVRENDKEDTVLFARVHTQARNIPYQLNNIFEPTFNIYVV